MQGFLSLLRSLLRLMFRLVLIYVVFLTMAWILLGMHPSQSFSITCNRIVSIGYWVAGFAGDVKGAGQDMARMGGRHLKEAQDRYHGIDPYEDYNRKLTQDVQQGQ